MKRFLTRGFGGLLAIGICSVLLGMAATAHADEPVEQTTVCDTDIDCSPYPRCDHGENPDGSCIPAMTPPLVINEPATVDYVPPTGPLAETCLLFDSHDRMVYTGEVIPYGEWVSIPWPNNIGTSLVGATPCGYPSTVVIDEPASVEVPANVDSAAPTQYASAVRINFKDFKAIVASLA